MDQGRLSSKRETKMAFFALALLLLVMAADQVAAKPARKESNHQARVIPSNTRTCGSYCQTYFKDKLATYSCNGGMFVKHEDLFCMKASHVFEIVFFHLNKHIE
ncbi:hypothetical protein L484_017942 [Morus notabilis]|uniref:Uncharacterized protein n=1 Tax=Morus notabilis TaxID=981085 RepID=W9RCJ0_9ROSA|nr:hypothetical protein L484_017942 [Morus notabilis]